jgi:hypothetical protein
LARCAAGARASFFNTLAIPGCHLKSRGFRPFSFVFFRQAVVQRTNVIDLATGMNMACRAPEAIARERYPA